MEGEGRDPLRELPLETIESSPPVPIGATMIEMRDAWIEACMEFNEQRAESVISQALAMYPPETVCMQILQKGLSQIGVRWYEGLVTAQQEHFASALAMRRLEALVGATPPPTRTGRILVGCAPEEEHTFSALLLTLLLRRRGWEALYLGANVPLVRLEATIAAAEPRLVILTAQTLNTAATLYGMAEVLEREDVALAYGGLIFSINESLRERIPGFFLGRGIEDAPATVEQLVNNPAPKGKVKQPSDAYRQALDHFSERQARIESIVWDLMADVDVRASYLARANRDLSRNISAALTLGDIDLVGDDIDWIEGLLMNYHYRLPQVVLGQYVHSYYTAAARVLDERGAIVVNWLAKVVSSSNPAHSV
jgi:methanogenic corrinoid protein MtbC1